MIMIIMIMIYDTNISARTCYTRNRPTATDPVTTYTHTSRVTAQGEGALFL